MEAKAIETPATRRHELDWLRIIAIFLLIFFHTGMWFNPWDWHVKNNELSGSFRYWMIWMHFWRMPLLLFISGAGTFIAVGKRTMWQFAGERIKRLFVPLLVGIFVIVPPQIYFEHITKYADYWDFYKTVFEFTPYPAGSFSWHHLWFIAYLLVYSLLAIPLLMLLRSDKAQGFKSKTLRWLSSHAGTLFIPSLFIIITQAILRPYFPDQTHDLTDLSFIVFYGLFYAFGIVYYSIPALWSSIHSNRKYLLWASVLILIPFYGTYFHFREMYQLPWHVDTIETIFDVSSIFLSWFTVITIIAYGQHLLTKPHPWHSKINEAAYPFYILHQTVIIWIGFYICQLDWGIAAKFWSISFLTLVSCTLLYVIVIRPFAVMRFLFGMKVR
jgi:glucans biosynthesis protein C